MDETHVECASHIGKASVDDTLTDQLTEDQWQQLDQAARTALADPSAPAAPYAGPPAGGNPPKPSSDSTPPGAPGKPLRLDPGTGLSVWLKDHADYHLTILMAPTGPFRNSEDTAKITEPLPYEPPPKGLFSST